VFDAIDQHPDPKTEEGKTHETHAHEKENGEYKRNVLGGGFHGRCCDRKLGGFGDSGSIGGIFEFSFFSGIFQGKERGIGL